MLLWLIYYYNILYTPYGSEDSSSIPCSSSGKVVAVAVVVAI